MRQTNRISRFTIVTLVALAGAAPAAVAQQSSGSQPSTVSSMPAGAEFRSLDWLVDRDVNNDQGDEIASISDFIVDRGSGRIEYAILKTGTILGMGGKTIAVPYNTLRWDSSENDFLLASTKDQLKQYPEFSTDEWSGLKDATAEDRSEFRRRLAADQAYTRDPYAGSFDSANHTRIEGEVKSVDRTRTSQGEQVIVTIAANDGQTRKVALGPSWFVSGGAVVPNRGDKISVETYSLPRDPDQMTTASSMRINDRDFRFRESDGSPAWAMKSPRMDDHSYSAPYWRYVLLSDLEGNRVDCRGVECGKVDDVIVDRRSGDVAFLSIDPDDNFLGVGDTKRIVPWTVATIGLDGTVRIDASKEMVLASPETPSDFSRANSSTLAEMTYKAYQVPAPRFEPTSRAANTADGRHANDAWGHRGAIFTSIDPSTTKTITGKIDDITQVSLGNDIPDAKALKIDSDNGDEVVLIGPAWYMDNQDLACKEGDTVTLDVKRTTINGKSYWIAHSLNSNGKRVTLVDGDSPVWDR